MGEVDAAVPHLLDRPVAVTGLQVHRRDTVLEDGGGKSESDRVECGCLHAVVGRQPRDDDPLDPVVSEQAPKAIERPIIAPARRRARLRSSEVLFVIVLSPDTPSQSMMKPKLAW